MITILFALASLLSFRVRSRASLELGLVAPRHQVTVLRRQRPGQLRLVSTDRLLWVWLYRVWPQVLNAMVLVKPATVLQWHRKGLSLRMAEQASNCFERGCRRLNLRPCTESDEEPDKVQRDIVIESAEAARPVGSWNAAETRRDRHPRPCESTGAMADLNSPAFPASRSLPGRRTARWCST